MKQKNCIELTEKIFKQIQNDFPEINMIIAYNREQIDLAMDIPKQVGLDFDISLTLQDLDELHIYIKNIIHSSFFPANEYSVSDVFYQTVVGLINGKNRILRFSKEDKIYKTFIQQLKNDKWVTVSTSMEKFMWPWIRLDQTIIQNKNSS